MYIMQEYNSKSKRWSYNRIQITTIYQTHKREAKQKKTKVKEKDIKQTS